MDIYSQLRRDEGERKFPYKDTVGDTTIGVGRNLSADGLSEDEITLMLGNDVKDTYDMLNHRLPWFGNLDPTRQGAIMNMAFNLGFNGLEKFPAMLAAMAKGDWEGAAREMLNSEWAGQVKDRAKRLANQIVTGAWT